MEGERECNKKCRQPTFTVAPSTWVGALQTYVVMKNFMKHEVARRPRRLGLAIPDVGE